MLPSQSDLGPIVEFRMSPNNAFNVSLGSPGNRLVFAGKNHPVDCCIPLDQRVPSSGGEVDRDHRQDNLRADDVKRGDGESQIAGHETKRGLADDCGVEGNVEGGGEQVPPSLVASPLKVAEKTSAEVG